MKIRIDEVIEVAVVYLGLSKEQLLSYRRTQSLAQARQVLMKACRDITKESYPVIAYALGDRDHTTILYGFQKAVQLIESDEELREAYQAIIREFSKETVACIPNEAATENNPKIYRQKSCRKFKRCYYGSHSKTQRTTKTEP